MALRALAESGGNVDAGGDSDVDSTTAAAASATVSAENEQAARDSFGEKVADPYYVRAPALPVPSLRSGFVSFGQHSRGVRPRSCAALDTWMPAAMRHTRPHLTFCICRPSQLISVVFAFAVLGVLMLTYLYCRTKGIIGPDGEPDADAKTGPAASVTRSATDVSVVNGHPEHGQRPTPAVQPGGSMSEGVPKHVMSGGHQWDP